MMLAAVETVTKADPVWESRRHNWDVAAQATARESINVEPPRISHGFQNPCDGIRNARLKRDDEFSHAMIIVISAIVSSS